MSYFADLTPHTYAPAGNLKILNVGWLDIAHSFPVGETPPSFHESLLQLCKHPVHLQRGFHVCQFCPNTLSEYNSDMIKRGNGQIRVEGERGIWYAAPTMIHHYVTAHAYLPPTDFVNAVLQATSRNRSHA